MTDRKTDLSRVGIVHLGVGAFFRAFGLPQIQRMQEKLSLVSANGWDVVGVSFRTANVRNLLAKNDFRYHALELGITKNRLEEIKVLKEVYFLQEQRAEVMRVLASPEVKMVTLTISEKGYCYSLDTKTVDWGHPQIQEDLAFPEKPKSAPGLLLEALKNRRKMGIPSFSCVSCDNLSKNGNVLQTVVLDLALKTDPSLADWISQNTPFPSTMVDRIVPAITVKETKKISNMTAWNDPAPVQHEPFFQWVIEDCFSPLPRPPLELAGVNFVKDVKPYEEMKLRLLNATHSTIAYTGQLLKKETVSQAIQHPVIANFIRNLWKFELRCSLEKPPDIDLDQYTSDLLARYENPKLAHETLQIAMDGSKKLPPRILAPLRSNLKANRSINGLSIVVACWISFLVEKESSGKRIEINDPMRDILLVALKKTDIVRAILDIKEIFGRDLKKYKHFETAVQGAYTLIERIGLCECLKLYPDNINFTHSKP